MEYISPKPSRIRAKPYAFRKVADRHEVALEARRSTKGARQSEDQLPTPRDQRGLVMVGTPGTVVVDGAGAGFRGSVRNGYSGIEAALVEHVGEQQRRGASVDRNHHVGGASDETRALIHVIGHGMIAHGHGTGTDRRRSRPPRERDLHLIPFFRTVVYLGNYIRSTIIVVVVRASVELVDDMPRA